MDLREAVSAKLQEMIDGGKIDELIEKQLQSTIKDVLSDSLRSYSDFGKNLKEKLGDALKLDFDQLGLPKYNDLVLKVVKDHMSVAMQQQGVEELQKKLGALLNFTEEIKFSELLEKLCKYHEDESRKNNWDRPSVHLELSKYSDQDEKNPTDFFLYFDEEPNEKKYRCKYSVFVTDGRVNSVSIDTEGKLDRKMFLGPKYDFERILLQMYLTKPRFIIDCSEDEVFYPEEY